MQRILRWWQKIKWKHYLLKKKKSIPIPDPANNFTSISGSELSIDVLSHYLLGMDHKAWYQVKCDANDMNTIFRATEIKQIWNYIVSKTRLSYSAFDRMPSFYFLGIRTKLAQYEVLREEIIYLIQIGCIKSSSVSPNSESDWSSVTIGRDIFLCYLKSVNSGGHKDFSSLLVSNLYFQRPFWKPASASIKKNRKKYNTISPFPEDEDRRPKNATMIIISEFNFKASVTDQSSGIYDISDLGLSDRRNKDLPATAAWKILLRLAEAQEYTDKMAQYDHIAAPATHITDLRNILKIFFGIHGDPFPKRPAKWSSSKSEQSKCKWTPSIHLIDSRGQSSVKIIES